MGPAIIRRPIGCSFAGGNLNGQTAAEGYMSILGTRVVRTEDPRLLTAGGVYVDDLRTPELHGAARLTFVRSPLAHARITGIDTSAAASEPGVVAVLTVRDMDGPGAAPARRRHRRRRRRRPAAARRPVGRAAAGGGHGAVRRRTGRGRHYRRPVPGRGRRQHGQRGLRAAARGSGTRRRGQGRVPCCSPRRQQRRGHQSGVHRRRPVRRLQRGRRAGHRQPAAGLPADGGARHRGHLRER